MKPDSHPLHTPPVALAALTLALFGAFANGVQAAPVGGAVVGGSASIGTSGTRTTITQRSANAAINWQGFGIAAGESVRFVQPGAGSVALNRVVGSDPSAIFGSLTANGKVFLVNPNGVLFGPGAAVNVGGLVASTLGVGDADFMAGRYSFSGDSRASVVNHGRIEADGGYVALLGASVANHGVISARLGSVTLAAGRAVTLDVLGDNLLHVTVDRGVLDALVENGGAIRADGGQVLLTVQSAGGMLSGAVNNTGMIQAQTLSSRNGTIKLLGDMGNGSVRAAGTLDASAPRGGDGGFIETSAARVRVQDGARVTTAAARGRTGEWLIDPEDFTIGTGAGDNISGATLSALLVTNSVVITTAPGPNATTPGTPPVTDLHTGRPGNGDINVNDAVSWTAAPANTTLTLNATRDVNINRPVTAVNGNFVVCCGRDINVGAAITTTRGSVLLSAGRDIFTSAAGAMTVTDGNLTMCAADDIRIGSALTLTRGTGIPARSLGLDTGLMLVAGNGGGGPGAAAGTVVFAPLAAPITVTGPNAPAAIHYNPVDYTTPTNYAGNFALTGGATLAQRMMVYPDGANKTFDGTTAASLAGLKGAPVGVVLVAGPGSTADFATATVGVDKTVTFTGFTLAGPAAAGFALPVACCGPVVGRTLGTIIAAGVPGTPVPGAPLPGGLPVPPLPGGPAPTLPVAPVPVPTVVVPPDVIIVDGPGAAPAQQQSVMPQFAPFVVAPLLLGPGAPLLFVAPPEPVPMALVTVQAPVEAAPVAPAAPQTAPAVPEAAAPAPMPVPLPRPARPFRN